MESYSSIEALLQDAARRAATYLASLADRAVAPSEEALTGLATLGGPLPERPDDPLDVFALLDRAGSPATVASAGPRYFGFVVGGTLPAALAAQWLAAAWDQNAVFRVTSPVAAAVEQIALGWLLDVLGLPTSAAGAFVTSATMANFTALAAARHAVLARAGWDVESDGMFGAPPITVIVGEEVHVSLLKALSMLGLGRERVVRVPVDGQGQMRADLLPRFDAHAIVCMQAGNVNTGAIDPAAELCARAHETGAWVHVDGAFGLWLAASPDRRALLDGVAEADSWATDAHKWLNVSYDSGLAFCRDADALAAAMAATRAAYLAQGESDEREPSRYTPEMSRRARGIEIWAALRSLGREGLADLIERTCRHARRFAESLSASGYQILNEVVANQVLVSFGPPEVTRRVIAGVQADGTCWCGGTTWQGHAAMRISVSSWATTEEDVERSLDAILRVARAAHVHLAE